MHGYKQFVQNSNEKTVIYKSPLHLAADLFAPPYTEMDKKLLGFVTGSLGSYNQRQILTVLGILIAVIVYTIYFIYSKFF